ncbi:MAG: carboxypeptidase M32 [Planctomycetota bacterium]|jgi:carboxypeptidase Taq
MPTSLTATSTASGPTTPYDELIGLVKDASLLGATASLLGWDQETMMPEGGLEYRSRQLAQLASLHHRAATDPRVGECLAACEADAGLLRDPTGAAAVNVREIRHRYDRQTKLPTALVEELAQTTSLARHVWGQARKDSDFARFRPWLEKVVELTRRAAECYGWPEDGEPWDALAEDYEPGCTAAQVQDVFGPLRARLQPLIGELAESSTKPSNAFNELKLPIGKQESFVRYVSELIGFEYTRGRLDRSTHPFCSGTHCHDVRLTTRFRDDNVNDALGSTMHESGHGIYEQGLPAEHVGTPMGTSVSLGIHESQSRMWENQVGRSWAFWSWCFSKLGDFFGSSIGGLGPDDVYGGANIVKPDFIRVEADEATYNMHIMVRFEIERALMKGDLAVPEIPGAWNDAYKAYLGLDVPDDRRGCLQDIHWSLGSIGYFPTYTLGNLYAAQFFEKVLEDMPDLYRQFERGEFGGLKKWLNEKIHAHGQRYRAADLCQHVTGKSLSADPLMRHLEGKLRPLYGM